MIFLQQVTENISSRQIETTSISFHHVEFRIDRITHVKVMVKSLKLLLSKDFFLVRFVTNHFSPAVGFVLGCSKATKAKCFPQGTPGGRAGGLDRSRAAVTLGPEAQNRRERQASPLWTLYSRVQSQGHSLWVLWLALYVM